MLNKEASEVLDILFRLAMESGDTEIESENQAIKIANDDTFMPVSVEVLNLVPWVRRKPSIIIDGDAISVCHYGEQNGDLMRDPEMVFTKCGDTWIPTYFRNDYVGFEQLHPTEKQKRDMAEFANTWMINIKQQQNLQVKCKHDWTRILTGVNEGDYKCAFCNEIKTKRQLDEANEFYLD
jgi:glycosidase